MDVLEYLGHQRFLRTTFRLHDEEGFWDITAPENLADLHYTCLDLTSESSLQYNARVGALGEDDGTGSGLAGNNPASRGYSASTVLVVDGDWVFLPLLDIGMLLRASKREGRSTGMGATT